MDSARILDSRYSWLRLGLSVLIGLVGNVGIWAIILVLPDIQAEFGVDRADASLAYVLTMAGFAAGNLGLGRIVDRHGAALTMAGSAVLAGLGYLAAAASPGLPTLALAHVAIGFATAASFGPLIADVSLWFLRRRGIAVAIAAAANYLSGAFWPLVLGDLLDAGAWRTVYVVLALATLGAVVPLSFFLRRRVPAAATAHADSHAAAARQAISFSPRRLQYILALAGLGCCVAMAMPQVHVVALSVDLGYGPAVGGEMLSLMLAGGVVSRLVSGMVADRLGGVRTLLIGSVLQCMALFLYLPFDGLTPLYIVSLIFGLSQGGIVPSYAIIVREYMPAREAGQRVGFVLMITIFGMALGGWMSGWIFDQTGSYQLAFLNGIAWNLLNISVMVMLLLRSRPRQPVPA